MSRSRVLVIALVAALAGPAGAKEIEVIGRGAVAIPAQSGKQPVDYAAISAAAGREALRNGVIAAVEKVLGPNASADPRVAAKLDAVAGQVGDDRIVNRTGAREGDIYKVALTIVLDDKEFRTLLSDLGIAVNTSTARSFSILAVMDEFVTTPRDLRAPLEELEEFSSSKGASGHDRSTTSASSSSFSASAKASATVIDATASESSSASARRNAQGKSASAEGTFSASEHASLSGSSSSSSSVKGSTASSASKAAASASKSSSRQDVAFEAHDDVTYKKLVKYQPHGGTPEKTSQAYNAFMGQLQEYDLRVLDNDLFKSRYFKESPLTIEQLQASEQLAKYVSYARTDANADFFMVGNSIVIEAGHNPNTGDLECTVMVTIKTYSTADGEAIASETFAESAAGRNINDCAAVASKKVAGVGGPILGARVQEYWKRRNTYGREYVVSLLGQNLPLMVRTAFSKAVKQVPGVEGDQQRLSTGQQLQLVVTYKGSEPIEQAVATNLASNAAFANLDARTDGNQVILCMGPCAEVEKAVKQ